MTGNFFIRGHYSAESVKLKVQNGSATGVKLRSPPSAGADSNRFLDCARNDMGYRDCRKPRRV